MKLKIMLRTFVIVLILPLAILAQQKSRPEQQQDDDVIRVETNLVTVPVTVKTREGAYVSNLTLKDFQIYEDGVEQEISRFDTVDQPFTVILMLDVSDSTKSELKEIQEAAIAFLDQLNSDDRAVIVSFDKQILSISEPSSDRGRLIEAVAAVKTGGGTALYDAVETAIRAKQLRKVGRKAIVILTDGIDTSSVNSTFDSSLALASAQYALIYPVQYNSLGEITAKRLSDPQFPPTVYTTPSGESLSKAYERGTRYLQRLAGTSGGRFHFADNVKNLRRVFALIAQELRGQYSLSYYPRNQAMSSGKRRIKVRVTVPQAVIHARESYTYKSPSP